MLAWAFVTGACLGVLYDLLRALRMAVGLDPRQGSTVLYRVVLFVEDVFFAVTATVALILLCYYTNDGLLRGPAVWGMAGGFFVYVQTVGRLTVRIEKTIFRLLRRLVSLVLSPLRRPAMWVFLTIRKGVRSAWRALFGRALDRRREKRQGKQVDELNTVPPEPVPFNGKTVFSTRRHS
ncbi:MAG: spore cortex biosynthesis protein YabQ [Clostridia bacterium]|nr:spore cortex biosynthesis protein YabQ [Clostridia bacterium]